MSLKYLTEIYETRKSRMESFPTFDGTRLVSITDPVFMIHGEELRHRI